MPHAGVSVSHSPDEIPLALNALLVLLRQLLLSLFQQHTLGLQIHRELLHLLVLLVDYLGEVPCLLLGFQQLQLVTVELALEVPSLLLPISVEKLSDFPNHVFEVVKLEDLEHSFDVPLELFVFAVELYDELDILVDVIAEVVFFKFAYVAALQRISEVGLYHATQRVVALYGLHELLLLVQVVVLQLEVLLAVALLLLPRQHLLHFAGVQHRRFVLP